MDYIMAVLFIALLIFVFAYEKRRSYREGFKAGAAKVLGEWKEFHNSGEEYKQ